MGDERGFLGARVAAGAAHSVRGAGESGAGAIFVPAEVGWGSGISRDAGGCVSAGIPRQDSELLELAFVGDYSGAIDVGGFGADVYLGRLEVSNPLRLDWVVVRANMVSVISGRQRWFRMMLLTPLLCLSILWAVLVIGMATSDST